MAFTCVCVKGAKIWIVVGRRRSLIGPGRMISGGITAGDTNAVMHLIAPDAVFVESGKIETRAEYEANHLPADIEFESKVKAERGPLRVTFDGRDTAWVISTAEYDEGNPEKYINTQLMVLTHDTGDWRIRSISWSSNQP